AFSSAVSIRSPLRYGDGLQDGATGNRAGVERMRTMRATKAAGALAAVVTAIALVPSAGQAKPAKAKPRLAPSATAVQAGGKLAVRISRTHGRHCVLTVRPVRYHSKVAYRRKVRAGSRTLKIPGSWSSGRRVVVVRCGARTASARFTVVPAPK